MTSVVFATDGFCFEFRPGFPSLEKKPFSARDLRFSSLSPLVFSDQSEREEHLQFDFVPPPAEVSSFPLAQVLHYRLFPLPRARGEMA